VSLEVVATSQDYTSMPDVFPWMAEPGPPRPINRQQPAAVSTADATSRLQQQTLHCRCEQPIGQMSLSCVALLVKVGQYIGLYSVASFESFFPSCDWNNPSDHTWWRIQAARGISSGYTSRLTLSPLH